MFIKLHRAKNWEDASYFQGKGGVKYGFESSDGAVVATLIQDRKFADEMTIRITNGFDRFEVRGHKSIMDKQTPDEIKKVAENALDVHKQFA